MDFNIKFGSCPIYYTISKIEGKWKWVILYKLYKSNVLRYSQISAKASDSAVLLW